MKKILIIGDSFCWKGDNIKNRPEEQKYFWIDILKKFLPNYDVIIDSFGSRDTQSILENWIRSIKHLNENDFLIICIPYFRRSRLPLDEINYVKFKIENKEITNRFIGTHSYNNNFESLEFWKKNYDKNFFIKSLETQEIINASVSNQLTTIEVIESLIELTKCRTYVFSWDVMDIKSKMIEDRTILEKNIGYWETHQDVYDKSNGVYGQEGDLHWSYKMNLDFGHYVVDKFFINEKRVINII